MRVDPEYLPHSRPAQPAFTAVASERPGDLRRRCVPRGWPAHVAPSMGMLHDLAVMLSGGRASVSLERLPDDPVLRISLDDRHGVAALRGALLRGLSDRGFEETAPGLLRGPGFCAPLVGIGPVTAGAGIARPAFELWALDGVPADAAQAMEAEALP